MTAKGVDCYSYITDALNTVVFTVPKGQVTQTGLNTVNHDNLQVQSSNLPPTAFTGRFQWTAQVNGAGVQSGYNDISSLTGNLQGGTMTDMMSMPTIFGSNNDTNYTICYGFYDAGSGASGLTNQDQCWTYFTASYANWMGDLTTKNSGAANLPFHQFVLPGAHDAGMNTMNNAVGLIGSPAGGAFVVAINSLFPGIGLLGAAAAPLAIQNLAITQKDTITNMLNIGVRYFDFRPGKTLPTLKWSDTGLYHQHKVIPGMAYLDFLREVLTWLQANPTELVVVSCNTQGFAHSSMNPPPSDLTQCLDQARTLTGVTAAMVATGDASALGQTIGALRASNTRLIFLNQIAGETTKYDSYTGNGNAYATLDSGPIIDVLSAMNATDQAKCTYTVLQLQGTSTSIPAVFAASAATTSSTSSPLMSTKASFDSATLSWASANVANNLSNQYLTVLLNDFADNATVSAAIEITMKRMNLFG